MAFQRPGMSDFTGAFGANQGILVNLNRDNANGNLEAKLAAVDLEARAGVLK